MQLISLLRSVLGGHTDVADRRRAVLIGIAGITTLVCALVATAVLYAVPFGERELTAYLPSAGGVSTRDDVRVAGVSVGSVRAVELDGDRVKLTIGLMERVALGDHTTLDVKLLTPLGGRYISLNLAEGDSGIDSTIPVERTTVPYDVSKIVSAATDFTTPIKSDTLSDSIEELSSGLNQQPDALSDMIANLHLILGTLAQRSDQLNRGLNVLTEYSSAMTANRVTLTGLIREANDLLAILSARRSELTQILAGIARLFTFVHRPVTAFASDVEPTLDKMGRFLLAASSARDDVDKVLGSVTGLLTILNDLDPTKDCGMTSREGCR